jgi:hypothetical protein
MAYIINRFNGTQLTIVDDGLLDTTTSLGLIGRNYTGYGETQNENYVFLLENFSNATPPSRAISGQAWYDSNNGVLKVYNGTEWLAIGNATVSEAEPGHSQGGLWFDDAAKQLYISDGTTWRLVGPEGVVGFDVTKHTSVSLVDTLNVEHPVILTEIDGETISIYSPATFTISDADAIPGFARLNAGLNFKSGYTVTADVKGNADTASSLQNSVQINGVDFDGSADITIRASTTNRLRRGTYLTGTDWDGTTVETWGVDASPNNQIGKVVVRDSNGGFAASTITADLFGNVTGNVTATSGTSTFNRIVSPLIEGDQFTGNSATATRLQVPVRINTVTFDGTSDITLPVPAETLTGTMLAPNVLNSSLISVGKLNTLDVNPLGINVGNTGNILKMYIDSTVPTIESDSQNLIKLKLKTGSSQSTATGISFVSAASAVGDGVNAPALVPEYGNSVSISQRASLGLPSYKWGYLYSENANITNLTVSSITSTTPSITFPKSIGVLGTIAGNVVGNLTGNVTGNLVGTVTGGATLNMLKTGDSMTGNITWTTDNRGVAWSMNTDSASIKFYSLGDGDTDSRLEFNTSDNNNEYFRWTHSPSAGPTFESMRLMPSAALNSVLTVSGNIVATGSITGNYSGSGANITSLNASSLSTGTVPSARLSGSYNISITGNATSASSAGTATSLSGGSVNATTGSFSGRISQSSSGFHASSIGSIATRTNSGFYDNSTPTTAGGWPVTGSWYHLLSSTHTNDANYYAMQFASDFYNSNNIYYRSTAGNGNTAWNKVLHSGNYNEIVPSFTGAGASGNWNINITGNAASVTNGVTTTGSYNNPTWITGIAGSKVSGAVALATSVSGGSISGTTGTFSGVVNVAAGSDKGIRFPNDAFSGSGDTATITLETSGGEATKMTFRMTNDGDDGFRFIAGSEDGLTMNGYTVLHANNYTNWVPSKSGSGASGTWPINIGGQAASVANISSQQVINALGFTPVNGATTPSYLANVGRVTAESNGTGEPGSKLTLREVYNNGYPVQYGNVITLGGSGGGELLVGWSGTTGAHADNYVRSRRDTGNTWSGWAKIVTDQNIAGIVSGIGLGFTVTSGNTQYTNGFTNHVGNFRNDYNWFDVYPPVGKTMLNLLGFIPSIAVIHYAGGVNGDDSMRCTWSNLGDRIRVWVQNTEQRSTPAANWLAIWGN